MEDLDPYKVINIGGFNLEVDASELTGIVSGTVTCTNTGEHTAHKVNTNDFEPNSSVPQFRHSQVQCSSKASNEGGMSSYRNEKKRTTSVGQSVSGLSGHGKNREKEAN